MSTSLGRREPLHSITIRNLIKRRSNQIENIIISVLFSARLSNVNKRRISFQYKRSVGNGKKCYENNFIFQGDWTTLTIGSHTNQKLHFIQILLTTACSREQHILGARLQSIREPRGRAEKRRECTESMR